MSCFGAEVWVKTQRSSGGCRGASLLLRDAFWMKLEHGPSLQVTEVRHIPYAMVGTAGIAGVVSAALPRNRC